MLDYLLGNALLGAGQAGGVGSKDRFIGPPYYLLNDTFTTNRAAGAVNGTKAEPGPGVRGVSDTNGKLSLSGGQAIFATGGAGNGNPRLFLNGQDRTPGRLLVAQQTGSTGASTWLGWHTSQNNFPNIAALRFSPTTTLIYYDNNNQVTVGAYVESTTYRVAIALRGTGSFCFVKGGAFTNWTLLWIALSNNASLLYPGFGNSALGVFAADYLRVPAARWLPVPLASDGFSSSGATDGAGHPEGVAGGLGSGGNGLAWNDPFGYGTWSTSGGAASCGDTTGFGGGDAPYVLNAGKADAIVTAKVTRGGGTAGIIVRSDANANNYVKAEHNGTNARLIKVVGGTPTTLINTAAAYSAGAEIRAIAEGTKFRLYYNDALVGSEQTISDGGLSSGTYCGLVSSGSGINSFDDFRVYARGTGGEYSALDNF